MSPLLLFIITYLISLEFHKKWEYERERDARFEEILRGGDQEKDGWVTMSHAHSAEDFPHTHSFLTGSCHLHPYPWDQMKIVYASAPLTDEQYWRMKAGEVVLDENGEEIRTWTHDTV